jgi:hypothetical protein
VNQKTDNGKHGGTNGKEEGTDCDDTAFIDAMLRVKNPGKLMKRISEREDEVGKLFAKANRIPENAKEPTRREVIDSVAIKDLRIANDVATGRVELLQPAKAYNTLWQGKEVKFRRINQRWYCDIDPR